MAHDTACFDEALDWLLADEGIYAHHPQDHGGATQFGITQRAWERYTGRPATPESMRAIGRGDAANFYSGVYWMPLGLATWDRAAAISTFDMAVVQGTMTTVQMAQRALGVAPDGIVGPRTCVAAAPGQCADYVLHFVPLAMERFARICRDNPSQCVFLVGWTRRAMRLLQLVQR